MSEVDVKSEPEETPFQMMIARILVRLSGIMNFLLRHAKDREYQHKDQETI